MQAFHYLFITVILLSFDVRVQGTPIIVEHRAATTNPFGTQLTDYDQLYNNLTAGNRVRYYTAFQNCSASPSVADNNQGDEIDYFETWHEFLMNFTQSTIYYSSQVIKLKPKIVSVLSIYQITMYESITVTVSQINPSTYKVLNTSDYYCYINSGNTGAVYYSTPNTTPPPLLPSYNAVYSTLKAGSVVTYAVDYHSCSPTPDLDSDGGGAISIYDDIAINNVNVGIQFSGMFTISSSSNPAPAGLNKRSFSLFQNGTVIVTQMTLATDYHPILSNTLSCQLNNGTNNGAISFFARSGTSSDFKNL